ncbi:unnamed protein product [Prorocentrum cordatum]|uniref:Uncharacterized protein n=1 Tax=Prorocentrum cordatum TaxID=2364126 RepID=A0ABN9TG37_9DINO|nr:unnamed protein product [Polarella glacialis]
MIFVQDDYRWKGFEDCICRNITYYDLDGDEHVRSSSDWMQYPWGAAVDQCWRDLAAIFHLGGVEDGAVYTVRVHPRNNFAVGRGTILQRPLSQWRAAYELASRPVCHPGSLNESRLSAEVLRAQEVLFQRGSTDARLLHDQPGWTKHTSGGPSQHLRDGIYNVTPAAPSACAREVFAGRQCWRR